MDDEVLIAAVAGGDEGAATAIATGTGNPFGDTERTASSPLPVLWLTHLLLLTTVAAAGTALAGLTTTYAVPGAVLLRNLAGFTGLALLVAGFAAVGFAGARDRRSERSRTTHGGEGPVPRGEPGPQARSVSGGSCPSRSRCSPGRTGWPRYRRGPACR